MQDGDLFLVRATDGEAKRWLWNSRWHELPAGKELIFPAGPALQAVAFYTVRDEFGEKQSSVEVVPYAGNATLQPVSRTALRDGDGTEYGSLAELIEAVKARTRGPAEAG
jgi:hypothetical protein